MAFHAIRAGEGNVFISAGVECVSRYVRGSSDGLPKEAQALVGGGWQNQLFAEARDRSAKRATGTEDTWHDPREDGVLPDIYLAMGQTAENLAEVYGVTREEMDDFGVRSQNLAEQAIADGFWAREITPVKLPDGTVVSRDDGPRPGVTMAGVAALQPVFRPDGRVTAGNCCPLNDGAAAVIVMSAVRARELGVTPLARIISTGVTALSPEIMGLGPVEATRQALGRAGMAVSDVDLFEINEAFAAQVIPSYQQLGIPMEKLNVMGGAIAVGHPYGMTGARITGTLLNALRWRDSTIGVETMCVGGGQGMAMVVERLS
jgi:acetyl-CoA C-acetyltransferase